MMQAFGFMEVSDARYLILLGALLEALGMTHGNQTKFKTARKEQDKLITQISSLKQSLS